MPDTKNKIFNQLISITSGKDIKSAPELDDFFTKHYDYIQADEKFSKELFTVAVHNHGKEMLPVLAKFPPMPELYGLAAQDSKETWESVPAKLRNDKEFVIGAIKGGYWIYFRLSEQEKQNEAYARAFIEQCAENLCEIPDLSDEVKIPHSLWLNDDFLRWAVNHFEETSFFVPEPLRSDLSFVRKVLSLSVLPQYGLAFKVSDVDGQNGPDKKKYQEFVRSVNEKANLQDRTPEGTRSSKKQFKV